MEDDEVQCEYYDLLRRCKSTVDGLLANGRSDILSTYGGLRRTQEILLQIFSHGLQSGMEKRMIQYLVQQRHELYQSNDDTIYLDELEILDLGKFLEECLLGYYTSDLLTKCFITSDPNVVEEIFNGNALLKKRCCVDLLVACFHALEQNSLEILTSAHKILATKKSFIEYLHHSSCIVDGNNVDDMNKPKQLVGNSTAIENDQNVQSVKTPHNDNLKTHPILPCSDEFTKPSPENLEHFDANNRLSLDTDARKQSLHQEVLLTCALAAVMEAKEDGVSWFDENDRNSLIFEPDDIARSRITRMREISRSESSLFDEHGHIEGRDNCPIKGSHDRTRTNLDLQKGEAIIVVNNKPSKDLDQKDFEHHRPSCQLKRSSKVLTAPFRKGHNRSKSDQIGLPNPVDITNSENDKKEEKLSTSAPVKQFETSHQDYYYQPEDGYMFPKPYKGQSLISYLDSRSYDTGAELDKENAHFSICEALITAIEQMKCSKFFDSDPDDSDEEIKQLKCKINERRYKKRQQKLVMQKSTLSDRSGSTSQSTSSFFSGSTFSSSYSSSLTDETNPQEAVFQRTLSRSWENVSISPTQSKPSKESQNEHSQPNLVKLEGSTNDEELKPDDYSAEFVAKLLLKKFNGQKLPAASELKWMVTEEQVPQTLLPLPSAWPVSPDDALFTAQEEKNFQATRLNSIPTRLRGNFEWAPPRPQIIFSPHPYIKRKLLLQNQHYRCTGCGLKVTPSLSRRFRYCEYLGKYFCTSCHQNRMSVLPSKVISKWDFKLYPVSDFSFDFLKKMKSEPLFDIGAIDKTLYRKVKPLEITKNLRLKLHYAKGFLKACRHGQRVFCELQSLPAHITDDINMYSLDDFKQVKSCELQNTLKSLVNISLRHINDCQLCRVKGFVCEYCRDGDDILYPFELNKVSICSQCKACYHKDCFVPEKCPKCERLRARKRLLDAKFRETDHQN